MYVNKALLQFKTIFAELSACLVAHAVGVEEGDEDVGDRPLDVPEKVLVLTGVHQPRHDFTLENNCFIKINKYICLIPTKHAE